MGFFDLTRAIRCEEYIDDAGTKSRRPIPDLFSSVVSTITTRNPRALDHDNDADIDQILVRFDFCLSFIRKHSFDPFRQVNWFSPQGFSAYSPCWP